MNRYQRILSLFAFVLLASLSLVTPVSAQSNTVSAGQVIVDHVSSSYGDEWTYHSLYGKESIMVAMASTEIDAYLRVYNSAGTLICENDDVSDTSSDALIASCYLPTAESYTIRANDYYLGTGDYALTVISSFKPCGEAGGIIPYGGVIMGKVHCTKGTYWGFYGYKGNSAEIVMSSTELNASLEVYDEQLNLVATNNGSAGSDARVFINSLPRTGTYLILVNGYKGGTGAYTLTLD